MPSVDDRIVRMEFDNASFERKISTTLTSLSKLDKALELKGAAKGLDGISSSADKVNLSHIASAVEHISSRFSAMGAVAFSVINSLTQGALGFAKKVGGDILDPIISGGTKRAKNIEQAKFMFEGLGISVEAGMKSALDAVKGTAFGLDEAAKAAAQFGASGIKVGDEMTGALKGVAGAAAMTGSSFTEMADIFAGSAGTGKVTNMDLMQFATRGLNAAAAVGKVLGKTEAQVHQMATKGTLDFKTFAGAMNEAFGSHATEANKTYTGSLANLHAAMSRLGEAFIGPRLTQQRDIFNTLTPVVDDLTKALKPLFNTILGITQLMASGLIKNLKNIDFTSLKKAMPFIQKGLLNIFDAFGRILEVGKKAFKDIFPGSLGPMIIRLAKIFENLTKGLIITGSTAGKLRRIFDGVFSILSIGWTVVKELVRFFWTLSESLTGLGKGNVLEFFARIGDFFTNLQKDLVKGGAIKDFFSGLVDAIKSPIPFIKNLADAITNFFTGFDPSMPDKVGVSLGRLGDRITTLHRFFKTVERIWEPFGRALSKVIEVLDKIWVVIRDWFKELGQKIAATMEKGDFSAVLDALNVTLLGGIAALIAKWMKSGINVDLTGGVMSSLTKTFDQLTGVLKAMQTQVKAEALLKIAEAIALLTASVVVLALIDSAALSKALTAMAVGFGELMGSFALLTKMDAGIRSGATFDLVAGGMIAMATAMVIMSGAVAILAQFSWGDLIKGLSGIMVLLGAMVAISGPLGDAAPSLIVGGLGIMAIATGLTILAGAVKLFSMFSWTDMAKGIVGVTGALVAVGLAMQTFPGNMPLTGLGLILVATGLTILAGAMKIFATLDYSEMARGFVAIGGALVIIGVAMHAMPLTLPITAAGLVLVGFALTEIGSAMKIMGSMDWGQILKSLVALAGALTILAIATNAMSGAIVGAAAIFIVSSALVVLAGALGAFAALSWGDLLHGLVGIAAALALLGLAALALTPVIPEMLALGVALMAIGAGFALIGLGASLIAKAFETLAKAGKAGGKALEEALGSIGKAFPALIAGFAQGILDLITILAKAMPVLMKILGAFLSHLADTLIELIPKLGEIVRALIVELMLILEEYIPSLAETGLHILLAILQAISDNLPEIVHTVGDIVTGFLDAMTVEVPRIAKSLADFIVTAFTSAAEQVGRVSSTLMIGVGISFIKGFVKGIMDSVGTPMKWFMGLAGRVLGWIGNVIRTLWGKGSDLISGLYSGIASRIGGVVSWFGRLGGSILGWIGNLGRTLWSKGVDLISGVSGGILERIAAVKSWFEHLGSSIVSWVGNIGRALFDIGKQIIQGLWDGMKQIWNNVTGWLGGLGGAIKNLKGPPKEDAVILYGNGMLIMQGLHRGMEEEWKTVDKWLSEVDPAASLDPNIVNNITKVVTEAMDQISALDEFNPTITPVLDLTQVAEEAKKIGGHLATNLTPSVSYDTARTIASDTNAIKATSVENSPVGTGEVKFEQNIYAPEQLSTADIYRQTRSQITLAKEELKIP
jgi:phage-related protein